MVRQYYVPQVTELSEQELRSVFNAVTPPVCLLGGWAVHLHVNPGFTTEHGRNYIGSRDIDLGIHIQPEWTSEQLQTNPVGESLQQVEDLGYTRSRFGFVQSFLRSNQERITEEEAGDHALHEVFQVYIDIIPDTTELDNFEEAFGFTPPAEPLLKPVFNDDLGEPLNEYVSWKAPEEAWIVPPHLLAAMKIRSLPDREKSHKRVKDAADLHALLWYTRDYNQIKQDTLQQVTDTDLQALENAVDNTVFEDAANLLQVSQELIAESIRRLQQ